MCSVRINTEQSLRRHRETERTRATATVPDDVSENRDTTISKRFAKNSRVEFNNTSQVVSRHVVCCADPTSTAPSGFMQGLGGVRPRGSHASDDFFSNFRGNMGTVPSFLAAHDSQALAMYRKVARENRDAKLRTRQRTESEFSKRAQEVQAKYASNANDVAKTTRAVCGLHAVGAPFCGESCRSKV